jgi:hypothetical protein
MLTSCLNSIQMRPPTGCAQGQHLAAQFGKSATGRGVWRPHYVIRSWNMRDYSSTLQSEGLMQSGIQGELPPMLLPAPPRHRMCVCVCVCVLFITPAAWRLSLNKGGQACAGNGPLCLLIDNSLGRRDSQEPWFSNLSGHQNPLESILKHWWLGSISRVADSMGLGRAWELTFLTNSLMLLIWVLLFENHF